MVAPSHKYVYEIDASDAISAVSPEWLAFARENGALELTRENVLGRSLWEFIAGVETRQLYADIVSRVRNDTPRMIVPFRCDSPTLRRHMRLTIARKPADVVEFTGTIDRVEPRSYLQLVDRQTKRTDKKLTLCSCCKRALIETRGWMELEDAAAFLHLFEESEAPQLRQTICPGCAAYKQASSNG